MAKAPRRPNRAPKKKKNSKGGREETRILSPETRLALDRVFNATKKA
jgi:hypothetical protein